MVGSTHVTGTHAVAWVTRVNLDHAIKVAMSRVGGSLPHYDSQTVRRNGADPCRNTLIHLLNRLNLR